MSSHTVDIVDEPASAPTWHNWQRTTWDTWKGGTWAQRADTSAWSWSSTVTEPSAESAAAGHSGIGRWASWSTSGGAPWVAQASTPNYSTSTASGAWASERWQGTRPSTWAAAASWGSSAACRQRSSPADSRTASWLHASSNDGYTVATSSCSSEAVEDGSRATAVSREATPNSTTLASAVTEPAAVPLAAPRELASRVADTSGESDGQNDKCTSCCHDGSEVIHGRGESAAGVGATLPQSTVAGAVSGASFSTSKASGKGRGGIGASERQDEEEVEYEMLFLGGQMVKVPKRKGGKGKSKSKPDGGTKDLAEFSASSAPQGTRRSRSVGGRFTTIR